jgi:hypothetical protein
MGRRALLNDTDALAAPSYTLGFERHFSLHLNCRLTTDLHTGCG